MKEAWLGWVLASLSAGVGGSFALITYVHSNFVENREFDHLVERLERIEKKIDRGLRGR